MNVASVGSRDACNAARWPSPGGHYESWFVRANHPTQPLAFWIRYTIFAPRDAASLPEGELWAIWFDGSAGRTTLATSRVPISVCAFDGTRLAVQVGDATLDDFGLRGSTDDGRHRLSWSLSMRDGDPPLLLLPAASYDRRFPKAKALVARPACRFDGELVVDGTSIDIASWLGSQNHNWGSAHTDRYAWAQAVGFDGRDDAFLECSSARLALGPVLTPWLSTAVLRLGDDEFRFNALRRAPLGHVKLDGLTWSLRASNGADRLRMTVSADAATVVELDYRNPPGGIKVCRNSKLATCAVELTRAGDAPQRFWSTGRVAFELLGI